MTSWGGRDMNAGFPESMLDGLERLSPEPRHTRPDPCTCEQGRAKCVPAQRLGNATFHCFYRQNVSKSLTLFLYKHLPKYSNRHIYPLFLSVPTALVLCQSWTKINANAVTHKCMCVKLCNCWHTQPSELRVQEWEDILES